jgi:hypothetical protein
MKKITMNEYRHFTEHCLECKRKMNRDYKIMIVILFIGMLTTWAIGSAAFAIAVFYVINYLRKPIRLAN